ncbi:hypothetical protein TNCT_219031 [Trichonephila clavata]|uniref:Uncharacterized protein n=1 Tax=Trichonephila clavata TaxID=2740835 RepID=A0A8X6LE66_TRICU|nr:hypothetical protein TNCT_219031 [Trichonephila clavata]
MRDFVSQDREKNISLESEHCNTENLLALLSNPRSEAVAQFRLLNGHNCQAQHLYRIGICSDSGCNSADSMNQDHLCRRDAPPSLFVNSEMAVYLSAKLLISYRLGKLFFTIGAYRFASSDTKGIIANQRQVAVPACTATRNNPSHRHIGQCRLSRCFLNVTFEHMELFSPDRPNSQKTGQFLHPLGKIPATYTEGIPENINSGYIQCTNRYPDIFIPASAPWRTGI